MLSNILDYVLLGLIFAIVIYIFLNTFKRENMDGSIIQNNVIPTAQVLNTQSDQLTNLNENIVSQESSPSNEVPLFLNQQTNSSCPVDNMAVDTYNYVNQYVIGSSIGGCVREPEKYSDMEVRDYQNAFFGFKDKVDFSSSEGNDAVGRVNEMITCQNDNKDLQGKTIAEIFNSLTQQSCKAESQNIGELGGLSSNYDNYQSL